VAQLLKHMLALARTGQQWTLCCLWYEVPGGSAETYRSELRTFAAQLGDDATHFQAVTHQELFARMQHAAGAEHAEYIAYLHDRYIEAGSEPADV
jgi:hypothetical protein